MDNYFILFGLKESFVIDKKQLHRAYIAAQNKYHPDKLLKKNNKTEQLAAAQNAANINKAYHTLKDPLLRAEYMLSLHDIFVGSQESFNTENKIKPDDETLIKSMELREAIVAAGNSPEKLQNVKTEIEKTEAAAMNSFQQFYESGDYENAAQAVICWRFTKKIL